MRILRKLFIVPALCLGLLAQTKQLKTTPAPPPGVVVSDPIYPVALEDRDPMRDLQVQWDEIEIDTQRKLVEIEKNHEKQKQLEDQLKVLAIKYAQKKQINLDLYDMDPKDLKFVKRK